MPSKPKRKKKQHNKKRHIKNSSRLIDFEQKKNQIGRTGVPSAEPFMSFTLYCKLKVVADVGRIYVEVFFFKCGLVGVKSFC